MSEIKVIDENVDTKDLDCHYYDWDVVMDGESYAVFNFPDYVHTIGGKQGKNSLYCCPLSIMKCKNCSYCDDHTFEHDKSEENRMSPKNIFSCCKKFKPKAKDLMLFSGESCSWDITLKSENYCKVKWAEERVEHHYVVYIKRNGKKFYTIGCNDMDWGMAKARMMLTEIWEHPIRFSHRGYESDIINRKIFYNGYPAIIVNYHAEESRVMIEPDKEVCDYILGYDGSRYVESFAEILFNDRIFWWRSEEDTEKWLMINKSMSVKTNFPLIEKPKSNEYVGDNFHQ